MGGEFLLEYLVVRSPQAPDAGQVLRWRGQRVALARRLANCPRTIRADVSTAALDSKREQIVMDLLFKIAVEQQATMIAEVHDEKIFDRFERLFSLRDDRLEQDAS